MKHVLHTVRWAACAGALALVAACAVTPQIYHGQLSALDKGMSQAEATARLKQPALSTHRASAGARQFEFHRYLLNNGVQADDYLLAYEGGRLVFWGYVAEFRRHPDAGLNTAVTAVLPELKPLR
jgi:hypothetical protein